MEKSFKRSRKYQAGFTLCEVIFFPIAFSSFVFLFAWGYSDSIEKKREFLNWRQAQEARQIAQIVEDQLAYDKILAELKSETLTGFQPGSLPLQRIKPISITNQDGF